MYSLIVTFLYCFVVGMGIIFINSFFDERIVINIDSVLIAALFSAIGTIVISILRKYNLW